MAAAKPQISVIIPAYNVEKHITRCLRSLENQTLKQIEIIVIDDGSADGTQQAIRAFMEETKLLVRLFSDSNHGQAYARNFGMRQAEGTYLAFIDSDDYLEPDYLENLYETAQACQSDVVNSGYRVVKEDGSIVSEVNVSPFSKVSGFGRAGVFVTWSKLYRKEFLLREKIRFPEGRLYEDVPFSLEAKFLGKHVKSISNIGYNYVQHENSTMSASSIKSEKFPYQELDASLKKLQSADVEDKHALEFEVLHFFTGFLFLYCKKASKEEINTFCRYAMKELAQYFPNYRKNPYVGIFRSKELPFYYRAAISLFVMLSKLHLLTPFTYLITR
ncbi:MAG: glycosyltransferase family 2 protein [Eubacterium sp.]|jgi:glycosyltransferase involved in cell wall biosynthesis|nr:glycosyltransferase family 2 protein [Eubacterium sp.]